MKRHISLLLAFIMALCLVPQAQAFDDVSDLAESAAAESLASIGIVDSVDRFNPQNYLTRAQFCKIAVLAAGFTESSLYSGYTIYPDVAANTWYAPYVNAAVRKYSIIQGDEKGNFNPNANITYGEAVTIMLRMLGYTTEDVGMMWPNDYVNKAQSIGLNAGMRNLGAKSAMTRGQAAILMCNMLLSKTKEGDIFAAKGYSTGSARTILLSTSQTNPTLSSNQAVLYLDGEMRTYQTSGTISTALCGMRGIPVFDARSQSRLKGFIADVGGVDFETVTDVTSTAISVKGGRLNVPRDTLTMAGGNVGPYITAWFDIKAGDEIAVYYNESGELELIATRSQATVSVGETGIYGVDTFSFQGGAKLVKGGTEISKSQLQQYDVISYSQSNNTYYVSSDRITLLYQSGSPVYSNPSQIKAGNHTFQVSEKAGKYFSQSGIKLGGQITLLLDYNGNLAAVMPSSKVSAKAVGVLSSLTDTSCTIDLLSGLKLEGRPKTSGYSIITVGGQRMSTIYRLEGQLVEVSQNSDGNFALAAVDLASHTSGDLYVSDGTIGKRSLAANAAIYECAEKGMTLHKISLSDIPTEKVSASRILYTRLNSADQVDLVVLADATGNRFTYGMIKMTTEKVESGEGLDGRPLTYTQYNYTIRTSGGVLTYSTATASDMKARTTYTPAAIASDLVGEGARTHNFSTPAFTLSRTATVSRSDYDTYRGFKVKGQYIPVDDKVVIYSQATDSFISSISEARANFTEFELYLDRPAAEGGSVRVIIVK